MTPKTPRPFLLRFSAFCGAFALAAAFGGCAPAGATHTPQPALCGEHPELCRPRDPSEEHTVGDSGWLCCILGGNCIAVDTSGECVGGYVGWCSDYTEAPNASGQDVATCHDQP